MLFLHAMHTLTYETHCHKLKWNRASMFRGSIPLNTRQQWKKDISFMSWGIPEHTGLVTLGNGTLEMIDLIQQGSVFNNIPAEILLYLIALTAKEAHEITADGPILNGMAQLNYVKHYIFCSRIYVALHHCLYIYLLFLNSNFLSKNTSTINTADFWESQNSRTNLRFHL